MSRRDLTSLTSEDRFDVEAEARRRGIQPYQVRAMQAVPDRLVRDIVGDAFKGISQSASMISPSREPAKPKGTGWQDAAPVRPPSGIDLIDQMCEAQDRADRAAAIRQKIETEWIESHVRRDPYKAATEYDPFSRQRMGHDDDE